MIAECNCKWLTGSQDESYNEDEFIKCYSELAFRCKNNFTQMHDCLNEVQNICIQQSQTLEHFKCDKKLKESECQDIYAVSLNLGKMPDSDLISRLSDENRQNMSSFINSLEVDKKSLTSNSYMEGKAIDQQVMKVMYKNLVEMQRKYIDFKEQQQPKANMEIQGNNNVHSQTFLSS
ncbi:UNKNOWN [Stylonychia lemnae]|uniref:Uncharacterized protein n=1 Tax=Stylonychia lemnae TaxID=5949 RepID=A0A078B3P0_STYLE|nr:UNKNOWN [Stylonychia lemnae]|eukprot:CDW88123.1 UNKNOWN [Stylonychia lemnae]